MLTNIKMKSSSTECQAKDRSKEFDPNDLSTLSEAMEDANDDENYTEPVANSNQTRIVRNPGKNGLFTDGCHWKGACIPPSAKLSMAMAVIL